MCTFSKEGPADANSAKLGYLLFVTYFPQYKGRQKCITWSTEDQSWKLHSMGIVPGDDNLLCHFTETGVYSYTKLGRYS